MIGTRVRPLLILAALGGLASLVVAAFGVDVLRRLTSDAMPIAFAPGLNVQVLLFSLAVSIATGPLVGDSVVMVGATVTVKGTPVLASALTVTTTLPVVAPAGTGTTMLVPDQLVGVAVVLPFTGTNPRLAGGSAIRPAWPHLSRTARAPAPLAAPRLPAPR